MPSQYRLLSRQIV